VAWWRGMVVWWHSGVAAAEERETEINPFRVSVFLRK